MDRVARGDAPCALFSGVPWLKGYFVSLSSIALGIVDPDPRSLVNDAARPTKVARGRNPLDDGGLVGLFASPERRAVLDEVQALMSLVEGAATSS